MFSSLSPPNPDEMIRLDVTDCVLLCTNRTVVISQLIHHDYALADLTGVLIAKLSSRCLHYFLTWPKHFAPLKLIVFFVHRNGYYTHLNESNIVKIHIVLSSISLRNKRSPTKSFSAFWPATANNYPLHLAREHLPTERLAFNKL